MHPPPADARKALRSKALLAPPEAVLRTGGEPFGSPPVLRSAEGAEQAPSARGPLFGREARPLRGQRASRPNKEQNRGREAASILRRARGAFAPLALLPAGRRPAGAKIRRSRIFARGPSGPGADRAELDLHARFAR